MSQQFVLAKLLNLPVFNCANVHVVVDSCSLFSALRKSYKSALKLNTRFTFVGDRTVEESVGEAGL